MPYIEAFRGRLCDIGKPVYFCKPPSERLKNLILRISKRKILDYFQIEKICDKWLRKPIVHSAGCGSVKRAVFSCEVFAAYRGKFFIRHGFILGSKFISVKEIKITSCCMWCSAPMFEGDYPKHASHCKKNVCRELASVLHGVHKEIRISSPKLYLKGEERSLAINAFICKFFERKYKNVFTKRSGDGTDKRRSA